MSYFNAKMRFTIVGSILALLIVGCAEESEVESAKRLTNDGDAQTQF